MTRMRLYQAVIASAKRSRRVSGGNQAPAFISAPVIVGTFPLSGSSVSFTSGSVSGVPTPTLTQQWLLDGVAISGATNLTYTPVIGDRGHLLSVRQTATNGIGSPANSTSASVTVAVPPSFSTSPAIAGTPRVGTAVSYTSGTYSGAPTPTSSQQWVIDGVDVSGATGLTYVPVSGDLGKTLTVRQTATNTQTPAASSASSGATVQAASTSPITPSLVASRPTSGVSGYAPLAVFFDASAATTSTSGLGTAANGGYWKNILTAFDFGDPTSGTHSISGLSRNTEPSGGPLAWHVFRNPGTYTVTATQVDTAGLPATAQVTITVQDPSTLVTRYISRSGNFAGAPAANGTTIFRDTTTSVPSFANNTRYLFQNGEDWSASSFNVDDRQNVHIGTFGGSAKVTVGSINIGTSNPTDLVNFTKDIRVQNMFVNNGVNQCWGGQVLFDNITAVRANPAGFGGGMQAGNVFMDPAQPNASSFINSYEVLVNDCVISSTPGTSGAIDAASIAAWNVGNVPYCFYGNGSRLGFLNTKAGRAGDGNTRFTAIERGVVRHCRFDASYRNQSAHALKVVSGYQNAYTNNWLASGGKNSSTGTLANWTTNKVVLANNYFGGGDNTDAGSIWVIAVCSQNSDQGPFELLSNVIVENNTFDCYSNTRSTWIGIGGHDVQIGVNNGIVRGNKNETNGVIVTSPGGQGNIPAGWEREFIS